MNLSRVHVVSIALAVLFTFATLFLAAHWSSQHPNGAGYDEVAYLNLVQRDAAVLRAFDSPYAMVKCYLLYDRERPPAHRVLTAPIAAFTGSAPVTMRIISIFWYLVAIGFLAAAAHKLGGPFAAAATITAVVLSPQITPPATRFGTEFPLMLAIGMTLFGFAHVWQQDKVKWWVWGVLGVGLGLGLLAKLSFGPILVLPLAATVFDAVRDRQQGRLWPLLFAGVGGAVLAATWYVPNIKPALAYAEQASTFSRHAIGSSADYPVMWARVIWGEPMTLWLIGGLIFALLAAKQARQGAPDKRTYVMAWVLIASPLVMTLLYFKGTNQNPRFMGPPMTPTLMGLALMAAWALDAGRPAKPRMQALALTCFATLALAQFAWVIMPHSMNQVDDPASYTEYNLGLSFVDYAQFDYQQLSDHPELGWAKTDPQIAMIGGGGAFNRQQIRSAWKYRGDDVTVDVVFDGYGKDGYDGPAILDAVAEYQAVIISPDYRGSELNKDSASNRFNDELIELIEADPRFEAPIAVILKDANEVEPAFTCLVYRVTMPTEDR